MSIEDPKITNRQLHRSAGNTDGEMYKRTIGSFYSDNSEYLAVVTETDTGIEIGYSEGAVDYRDVATEPLNAEDIEEVPETEEDLRKTVEKHLKPSPAAAD